MGLLVPGGGCFEIGVSDYVLGGGLSFLSRAYRLASDSRLSVRLVLSNVTLLNVSATEHTAFIAQVASISWAGASWA